MPEVHHAGKYLLVAAFPFLFLSELKKVSKKIPR